MKIVTNNDPTLIALESITEHHIVAAVRYGKDPMFLKRIAYDKGDYQWCIVNEEFTNGNSLCSSYETIADAIIDLQGIDNAVIEAFESWREAFQWMLDTAS